MSDVSACFSKAPIPIFGNRRLRRTRPVTETLSSEGVGYSNGRRSRWRAMFVRREDAAWRRSRRTAPGCSRRSQQALAPV